MTTQRGSRFALSGIELGLYPSTNRTLSIELQSATANSTASSMWQSVLFPPTQQVDFRYLYHAALSTRSYYFRARHPAQPGYSAGAFTPTVSARPTVLGTIQPPILPQMTYQGNVEMPSGSDVFVSSSKTVKVGTQQTTGTVTKKQRIMAAQMVAEASTMSWMFFSGAAINSGTTLTLTGQATVTLTPGVQVTAFRFRSYRETTNDVVSATFRRVGSTGGVVNLSSGIQATSGFVTTTGGAVAETISTQYTYSVRASINPSSVRQNARFLLWELEYKMPSYDRAV